MSFCISFLSIYEFIFMYTYIQCVKINNRGYVFSNVNIQTEYTN